MGIGRRGPGGVVGAGAGVVAAAVGAAAVVCGGEPLGRASRPVRRRREPGTLASARALAAARGDRVPAFAPTDRAAGGPHAARPDVVALARGQRLHLAAALDGELVGEELA